MVELEQKPRIITDLRIIRLGGTFFFIKSAMRSTVCRVNWNVSLLVPYYMKFWRHLNFANFAIFKKKNREIKVTSVANTS